MQVNIQIEGLSEVRAMLGNAAKQANFAASRALNTSAYAINDRLKKDMAATSRAAPPPTPCAPSASNAPTAPP